MEMALRWSVSQLASRPYNSANDGDIIKTIGWDMKRVICRVIAFDQQPTQEIKLQTLNQQPLV